MTIGCAPVPASAPEEVPVHGGGYSCNAEAAQNLVGRPATAELAAEAQRRTGARIVRWLQPGQIVTMEFREDRLNINIENGRVTRINCG